MRVKFWSRNVKGTDHVVTRPSVLNDCSSTNCVEASEAIDARKVGKKK
jgi:hypothetical protein